MPFAPFTKQSQLNECDCLVSIVPHSHGSYELLKGTVKDRVVILRRDASVTSWNKRNIGVHQELGTSERFAGIVHVNAPNHLIVAAGGTDKDTIRDCPVERVAARYDDARP
jgi:hypothetical protein